ncbi:MAG TPA: polyprenol monophosphomannose synthase [Abditibacteriaceae bacterium]|nr:polyprenol monophosphomannose synthase [Abditibacteriaceae bacterium]
MNHQANNLDEAIEIAVVIPTLNESGNIGRLLDGILMADPRLVAIVVDDGSRDGTDTIVLERAEQEKAKGRARVHLIERGRKMGYASAVQDGMCLALRSGARLILQMDADFSHDPKYLPALLAKSADCDLVVGSRYVPGGGTRNWGLDRKVLSAGANALARTLLQLPVRDCTGGFRCWKRELIERAGVLDVRIEGYAFLFVTLDQVRRSGAHIGEVPIIFVDREHGKSKMSRRIVLEAIRVLVRLALQRFRVPKLRTAGDKSQA